MRVPPCLSGALQSFLKCPGFPQYFDAKRQKENFKDVFPEQHKKYAERDNCMDIDTEAILSAFRLAGVQKDGKYINGFKENWRN